MTTKTEARKVADQFIQDKPHLAGRSVRCVETTGSGFNHFDNWYLVPRGPRGGLKAPVRLGGGNACSVIFTVDAGDIIMQESLDNGWSSYHSYVVYPSFDSSAYSQHYEPEFTIDEQIESLDWQIKHDNTIDEDYHLAEEIAYLLECKREYANV